MSGGHWQYMAHGFRERAVEEKLVWEALADCEHIMDWALSSDTSMEDDGEPGQLGYHPGAKTELWHRMERLFDELSGST